MSIGNFVLMVFVNCGGAHFVTIFVQRDIVAKLAGDMTKSTND
jgi:hypothetical protein